MSASHEDVKLLLGAYVLGGLGEPDLREVQDHLPTCSTCRDELADLAALPGLMRRRAQAGEEQPSADQVVTAAAPPRLLPDLLRQVAVERRRSQRRSLARLAVAAVTVAALTAGGGALLSSEDAPHPGAAVPFGAATGSAASGQATLLAKPWGTAITVDLAGLPPTGSFVLRTTGRDGTREQAAAWAATTNGVVTVVGATSISTADVAEVAVVGSRGQTVAVATPS